MRRILSIIIAALLIMAPVAAGATWTATGGGNHEGADWIISANTPVGGKHYNIGVFKVESSYTATAESRPAATSLGTTLRVDLRQSHAAVIDESADLGAASEKWIEIIDGNGVLVAAGWAKYKTTGVRTFGTNAPLNPDFASDTSYWASHNGAILASVAGGQDGNCLKIQGNGVDESPGAEQYATVIKNALYALRFYQKQGDVFNWWYVWMANGGGQNRYVDAALSTSWTEINSIYLTCSFGTSLLIQIGFYLDADDTFYALFDTVRAQPLETVGAGDLEVYQDAEFKQRGWQVIGSGEPNWIDHLEYRDTPVNLDIRAQDIQIEGTISADGKGFEGGIGGLGVYAGSCGGACTSCSGSARAGGNGTNGSGYFPGAAGSPGADAGYLSAAGNGDFTTTEFLALGSGGGGGRAGNSCTPNCNYNCPNNCSCGNESGANRCRGGSGGGNAHGGGAVILISSNSLKISGSITTKGIDSTPGAGGSSDTCGTGQSGSASGKGAGGGILLRCSGTGGIKVTGTIDTRGGNNDTTNYGSLKLFGLPGRIDTTGANIYAGHDGSGGYGWPLINEGLASPFFIF
jgi:hypothetical protein